MNKDFLPRLAFVLALLFFAYLGGFATSQWKWFPYGFLSTAFEQAVAIQQPGAAADHHIHPARHDFAGARTADGAKLADGCVLVTGYWGDDKWLPGLRLLDRDGTVLHRWNADPLRIWPESPHRDGLRGVFHFQNNYIHGSYLFDDGSVLLNIEYLGLARLDAKGDVMWTLTKRTHHSITRNERGNFWVCDARWLIDPAELSKRFPGLVMPVSEEWVLEVTPDGEVVREVSVLDAIWQVPELRRAFWTVGPTRTGDVTHLNDVEELPTAMAAAYPMLQAGDLLISLKHLDLVFVMDPVSKAVRWWRIGPYHVQHDPDFLGDGTISVYDNNEDDSLDGAFLGGSRLLRIGLADGNVGTIYPRGAKGERRFYSAVGGKAQRLADGHWLLSEPRGGRVLEVDADGHTVWEWCQERIAEGKMTEVLEGTLYPLDRERVKAWPR
ncbi:MAG: arylsulfotransferase family protein [Planctomycetota bacterium]